MKILSLFDGMACGHIAMQNAGVEIESYDAYEIDKYAIKVTSHNFPDIVQHGDVFAADFTQYEGVDFVIGGSPCTYWSIAQKNGRETEASGMGWELFQQYVRAVKEAKPRFFIYENNKSMSKQIRASIDEAFGFEAVFINSALVSAQNRQRLYWVGKRNEDGTYSKVNVEHPEDRGILLRDVLESATAWQEKSYALTTRCMGAIPEDTLTKHRYTMVAEPVNPHSSGKSRPVTAHYHKKCTSPNGLLLDAFPENPNKQVFDFVGEPVRIGDLPNEEGNINGSQAMRIYSIDGKAVTQSAGGGGMGGKTGLYAVPAMIVPEATTKGYAEIAPGDCVDMTMPNSKTRRGRSMKDKCNCLMTGNQYYQYCGTIDKPIYEVCNGMITIKGKQYPIKLADGFYIIRKLTVRECMRLQTVPEWYDFSVISNSQAYKCLGNGWTCDVITHLILSALNITVNNTKEHYKTARQ